MMCELCVSCRRSAGLLSDLSFNLKSLNEIGGSRNAKPSLEHNGVNAFYSCFAGTRQVCLCLFGLAESERLQGLRLSDTMAE